MRAKLKPSTVHEQRMQTPARKGLNLMLALLLAAHAAPSAAVDSPHRWIITDTPLLQQPSAQANLTTTLRRGTEVALKQQLPGDDYCLIEGLSFYGYVACQSLDAGPVAFARAGEAGIDASTRWVTAAGVLLRREAHADAAVLGRLGFNQQVRLLDSADTQDYCEVQSEAAERGFAACRYLAESPVDEITLFSALNWNGEPNPLYDPVRAFWIDPGWERLESYAQFLADRHRQAPIGQRWPRDEELEKMKAELDKGLYAPAPEALPDWEDMRRLATASPSRTHPQAAPGTAQPPDALTQQLQMLTSTWQLWLGLWGQSFDEPDGSGAGRIAGLVNALDFPPAAPSWFKTEREVAPPGTAQALSGRFGIIYRWQVRPRPTPSADQDYGTPGLYDMLDRTQVLVRSVQRVRLYRDGHLDTEKTFARSSETLWREIDEPMCNGWTPGFNFGAADVRIWDYFGEIDPAEQAQTAALQPPGSLYEFIVPASVPLDRATVSLRQHTLDRAATGFVRGSEFDYDLDHDGHPDILVWEGVGHGPGHLDGETTTDDAWYRLVLVNIGGHWKILGNDSFGYGCGC
jgi:hypothetical protein